VGLAIVLLIRVSGLAPSIRGVGRFGEAPAAIAIA
jgi:hypothetical protein